MYTSWRRRSWFCLQFFSCSFTVWHINCSLVDLTVDIAQMRPTLLFGVCTLVCRLHSRCVLIYSYCAWNSVTICQWISWRSYTNQSVLYQFCGRWCRSNSSPCSWQPASLAQRTPGVSAWFRLWVWGSLVKQPSSLRSQYLPLMLSSRLAVLTLDVWSFALWDERFPAAESQFNYW